MIYLDHAAATEVYSEVKQSLRELLDLPGGNPSSVHARGKEQRFLIDQARQVVAHGFGVDGSHVVFTSGATEALHLAVVGSYLAIPETKRKKKILVSPVAHSCVLAAVDFLVQNFGAERVDMPLQAHGHFDLHKLLEMNLENFDGVVVEHGNSELGILQDIQVLGEQIRSFEVSPFYIVDAAASFVACPGILNWGKESWKPDNLVLSGEKFGAPCGTGALVRFTKRPIKACVAGSHEFGLRGGTENVFGISAFGKALSLHSEKKDEIRDHLAEIHAFAALKIGETLPQLKRLPGEIFLSHIFVYLLPEGMKADLLVTQLDMAGICISSGAACSSGTVGGNKALLALGYTAEEARRSIRLSFGRDTKKEEIERFVEVLEKIFFRSSSFCGTK